MTDTPTPTTCSSCQSWKAERKPSPRAIGLEYTDFRRCNFVQQYQFSGLATFFENRTWTHPDATCADHRPRRQL